MILTGTFRNNVKIIHLLSSKMDLSLAISWYPKLFSDISGMNLSVNKNLVCLCCSLGYYFVPAAKNTMSVIVKERVPHGFTFRGFFLSGTYILTKLNDIQLKVIRIRHLKSQLSLPL